MRGAAPGPVLHPAQVAFACPQLGARAQSVLQSEGTWTAWGTRVCWPASVLLTLENPLVAVETCSLLTQFRRNPNL